MQQEIITQQLDSMQSAFVSGGLVLMAVGAVAAWLRNIPHRVGRWVLNRLSVTAEVLNSDTAFDWITAWVEDLSYSHRARMLSARVRYRENSGVAIELTPAPGNHFFRIGWRLFWLARNRQEGNEQHNAAARPRETITVRMTGWSQEPMRRLFADAQEAYDRKYTEARVLLVFGAGSWQHMGALPNRTLESVVLPAGESESMLGDMRQFLASQQWYQDRGVPWRRSYLLHGPPGTGKTSLIIALARELGLSVYFLNLSSCYADNVLQNAFMSVGQRSILVIEDIDAATKEVTVAPPNGPRAPSSAGGPDEFQYSGITLSGLLQALDGITSREGRITVMTTNHPERLEPRLVRAGRVDVWRELGYATRDQAAAMYRRFFPTALLGSAEAFATALPERNITPAEIQGTSYSTVTSR